MKHKKKLLAATLLLGVAAFPSSSHLGILSNPLAAIKAQLSGAPPAVQLAGLAPEAAVKKLRDSFLEISMEEGDKNTKKALSAIAEGLASPDEGTERTAERYAESVIIDAVQPNARISPAIQNELSLLVSLFKTHAKKRIQHVQEVFPGSPTLAYLRSN